MTSSDWITVIAAIAQVVATLSIGIPQLMLMRAKTIPTDTPVKNSMTQNIKWFASQAWPFLISASIGVWFIWGALASTGAVTRSFVISLVFGALLLSFSILTALSVLVVAIVFRPIALILHHTSDKPTAS